MIESEPTKEEIIAEIDRLIAEWQPRWCAWLLEEVRRMREIVMGPKDTPEREAYLQELKARSASSLAKVRAMMSLPRSKQEAKPPQK